MRSTLTLSDVAVAANVTRQAVTNWRRRSSVRGVSHPFPAAVATGVRGEEFDRAQVLDWLEATGRGRNAQARLDAQALTPPADAVLDVAVTALALRTEVGEDLAGRAAEEIAALAAEVDPDDRVLRSEILAIAARQELFRYIDEVFEASYGPTDALARLRTTRLARWSGERGLSDDVVDLLAAVGVACRQHLGDDASLALRAEPAACRVARGFTSVVVDDDDPDARAMRRHLLIDQVVQRPSTSRVVHLASLVGRPDYDVLDAVDALAVDLRPGQVAVILGPASALCDRLRGKAAANRASTLRIGNLVAAFRLPRGLWRHAHRQALGMWILAGGVSADRLVLADLTSEQIDTDGLVADVLGALDQSNARAYRYGRAVKYEEARARAVLVPPGIAPARMRGLRSSHREAVTAATLITREPVPGFDVLVTPAQGAILSAPRSLGQMVEGQVVALLNGSRIDLSHTEADATARVLSAEPGRADLRIDPLVAARHYPHARRTEPGDVVFAVHPRPAALVDGMGGGLVLSPSRILRLRDGAGIGPRTLAAAIDLLPDDAGEWRTWRIPRLAEQHVDDVEATLDAAVAHLDDLRRREVATQDLVAHLVQGVAVGDLVIDSSTPRKKAG